MGTHDTMHRPRKESAARPRAEFEQFVRDVEPRLSRAFAAAY